MAVACAERGLTSCDACSPSSSVRPGRVSSSHLDGGSSATCPSSSCSGNVPRPPWANRISLASTHPPFTPGSSPQGSAPSVRRRPGLGVGRMADGIEAPCARGSVHPARGLVCTLSNCGGGVVGSVRGRSPAFMQGWSRGWTGGRPRHLSTSAHPECRIPSVPRPPPRSFETEVIESYGRLRPKNLQIQLADL